MRHQTSSLLLFLGMAVLLGGIGCQTHTGKPGPLSAASLNSKYQRQFSSASRVLAEADLNRILLGRPTVLRGLIMSAIATIPQASLFVPATYDGEPVELGVIPSSNTNAVAGVRHMRNGDWSLAIECFGQALREAPEDHLVLFAAGVCHEKMGDDHLLAGAAESERRRALLSKERNAVMEVLAKVHADYSEALSLYKRANYKQPTMQGDASIRRLLGKTSRIEKINRLEKRQSDSRPSCPSSNLPTPPPKAEPLPCQ